jgi:hypothetical protein
MLKRCKGSCHRRSSQLGRSSWLPGRYNLPAQAKFLVVLLYLKFNVFERSNEKDELGYAGRTGKNYSQSRLFIYVSVPLVLEVSK